MAPDEWYKRFGQGRHLMFYHVLAVAEDNDVLAVEYDFDLIFRRVVAEERKHFDPKWWMERLISNDIHEIPSSDVPFRMSM